MSEPEALTTFHEWTDNRRSREAAAIVTFLACHWLAWVLLQISSGASWLARIVAPTP